MRKIIEITDLPGKCPFEVEGVLFDLSADVVINKLSDGSMDVDSIDIDDIAVLTNSGELLYLEGWKIPTEIFKKIEQTVMANALMLAERSPEDQWKENAYVG